MTKHYILNLNPAAKYEWDRCTLRDPITAEHPELSALIAKAVGEQAGSYLIAVNIEVQVLEKTLPVQNEVAVGQSSRRAVAERPEVSTPKPVPHLAELVA